ncbi:alpha/beta hydrolase [Nakamurella flavida]|uniref:Alpha/beta hydrolase n=1 Tax=Nakamurella flavida TaxID=363630 RepID=A0A938YMI4_9ACTN|nr:alpha/beta hydrolase [Nakamurella flavida]MBM9475793.1 alpha/beta hydrolase [Nakamurella flavida]MDP9777926.1 acetyl esterase/lipase [Nakamurella flavida]
MPYSLDPQVAAGLAALAGPDEPPPPLPAGDVEGRRAAVEALQTVAHALLPTPSDVAVRDFETTTADGATLLLRWYAKEGSSPGSAVLYAHGGGMILSTVAIYDGPVARYVSATGVPFLSVEYRYAPEHPAPTPVTDCHAGLRWLVEHADELGVDPARIAIMGDSGGGGVAASLAVYARDQGGPAVAEQILIYPMLDDRNTEPDPALVPFLTWTYDDNITGWGALLGGAAGGPEVDAYGAAARLTDFTGLPPAYIEVGELDIFRDEDLAYAQRLIAAGVSVELHLHPDIPHAAEALAPDTDIARRVNADRHRVIAAL